MSSTRPAAVAGAFYPASAPELSAQVGALLRAATTGAEREAPKAIIAPHAGYIYSGPVAASVYARLAPLAAKVKRVVLLGPAHRVAVHGLALPGAAAFETPLGTVPIDSAAVGRISDLPQVMVSPDAHALEHSLEVHVPFLQSVLGEFVLVPLVVGRASPEEVAEVLERLWGGEETLLVISSDLSHYLAYDQAQSVDRDTARTILNRQPNLNPHQACGAIPVNGLLLAAARKGLMPELIDLRNSGDTAGDRRRVVGYASFGFYPGAQTAAESPGDVLIPIARSAIGDVLGMGFETREDHAFLHEVGATFVTLVRHGKLRGCIGTLQAHRKLLADVRANAKAAAFLDPRFEPLTATELRTTRIEVSLLTAPSPIGFGSQEEAIALLRPGVDGVILEYGDKRGTFLPQVWEQLPDARTFFAQLKQKAGLPADFWAEGVRLSRYTVTKWAEPELPAQRLTATKRAKPRINTSMTTAQAESTAAYPARYWHLLEDGRIQCDLCPRDCRLHEGQRGACFVRQRVDDRMVLTTYGRSSGFCVDPVEKKPLNQFFPGSSILSFGTAGCNLACKFCQNWDISKSRDMDRLMDQASPEQIAQAAHANGCKSVAFTYNDPVIFAEYAMDVADACHARGIKTVAVTAGYMHEQPRRDFYAKMDAANVDLKAFTESFYFKLTGSHLQPVLDTLTYLKHETDVWFEITTLLIPTKNDSDEEITAMCRWMVKALGTGVPLHFTAFHPDYKMDDLPATPASTLRRARDIALREGLQYVYTGNVHDKEGGTTYCNGCGESLIVRDWYQILDYKVTDFGRCLICGTPVAGRYEAFAGQFGRRRVPVRISTFR